MLMRYIVVQYLWSHELVVLFVCVFFVSPFFFLFHCFYIIFLVSLLVCYKLDCSYSMVIINPSSFFVMVIYFRIIEV